jgi:hypothetical protein
MVTFDAPDREKCTGRRSLTNTPLQALVLMNDPTYVEAARVLAARAFESTARNDAARLEYAFRLATARQPSKEEVVELERLLARQRSHFRADPKSAERLLHVGDLEPMRPIPHAEWAAWTTVASVILNLDESFTEQ